jgi:hypothetical protein
MELDDNAWMRRLAAIVAALVVLIPAAFVPRAITNAQPVAAQELAYSQQTGYFFFWDPATASLEGESSDPGVDWWRLSDGEAFVDLWAFAAPDQTTEECVRNALDRFAADRATLEMKELWPDEGMAGGGPPQIWEYRTAFVLTVEGPDGQEKFAVSLECQEIVPGQSQHLTSIVMPAQVFNERGDVTIGGVDLFAFNGLTHPEAEFVSISDETSEIVATLTTFLPCNTAEFSVLARGESGGGVIDPSSFIAVDGEGASLPTALVAWSLPEARPETSLSLLPGEIGLMRGVVEVDPDHSFDLYYSDSSDHAIFLAPSLWGCGQGGGAPVLIDIE